MKLGITMQTFIRTLEAGTADELDIIAFAAGLGLDFVEIRNKNMYLDRARLEQIKEHADNLNIAIQYAWDGGSLLDDDYIEVYSHHLDNADIFGPGTISRVIIDPQLIRNRETPMDYTTDEMDIIHEHLAYVNRMANEKGIVLAYENSFESVWGFTDILEKNPGMVMTFDPANFLNCEQQKKISDPDNVMQFYRKYQKAIPYVHIKSTKDGALKDTVVSDGDFDWKAFFKLFDGWACLELPASEKAADCRQRISDSLLVLRDLFRS
jgi:sugar phosphate isomerase/epimerase